MNRQTKAVACGSTGLADALAAALNRTTNSRPVKAVQIPTSAPNPLLERRRREENNNRIKKHAAVIKRQDPRLYVEALQQFGHDLEGLNTIKQEAFIAQLVAIRKEYRI